VYRDTYAWREVNLYNNTNMLETVFKDGVMIKEQSLAEIRDRLHNGDF
jgi:hypothetical protein